MNRPLRIATRKSPLAMQQARTVADAIKQKLGWECQLCGVSTAGDEVLDRPLASIGGKEVFIHTLQKTLQDDEADIAVHSLKDMSPLHTSEAFTIAAIGFGESPNDCVISNNNVSLSQLPHGARIGTTSPRRCALLKKHYPHVQTVLMRGNIQTRIKKLQANECDALLLAAAGLERMNLTHLITEQLPLQTFIPAIGQGLLAIECLTENRQQCESLSIINNESQQQRGIAERAFAAAMRGDCTTAMGAFASVDDNNITIHAFYVGEDDSYYEARATNEDAEAAGTAAARMIRQQMPQALT